MIGGDQSSGIKRTDAGDREAALIIIVPAQRLYCTMNALVNTRESVLELCEQRLCRQLDIAEALL